MSKIRIKCEIWEVKRSKLRCGNKESQNWTMSEGFYKLVKAVQTGKDTLGIKIGDNTDMSVKSGQNYSHLNEDSWNTRCWGRPKTFFGEFGRGILVGRSLFLASQVISPLSCFCVVLAVPRFSYKMLLTVWPDVLNKIQPMDRVFRFPPDGSALKDNIAI